MCSVAGKAYRGLGETDATDQESIPLKPPSVIVENPAKEPIQVDLWGATAPLASSSRSHIDVEGKPRKSSGHESERFTDPELLDDIHEASKRRDDLTSSRINMFFTVLSLCHTVVTGTDPETGEIEYKAQSPDEAALVQAAADVGFVFLRKEKEILCVQTPGSTDPAKYELLDILEFTSARKRMSVVLRRVDAASDEDLLLLSKGADNVIFERLRPGEDELKAETENHLSEFASNGLRTLTLAYKNISGMFC